MELNELNQNQHALCTKITRNNNCAMNLTHKECLWKNLIKNEVQNKVDLIKEMQDNFPEYSPELLAHTINNIPLYINAKYAILLTLLYGAQQFPEFTLTSIQTNVMEYATRTETVQEEQNFNEQVEEVFSEAGNFELMDLINDSDTLSLPLMLPDDNEPEVVAVLEPGSSRDNYNNNIPLNIQHTNNCSAGPFVDVYREIKALKHTKKHSSSVEEVPMHLKRPKLMQHKSKWTTSSSYTCNSNGISPEVIVVDQVDQVKMRKLINTLKEIFPDCHPDFLENLCKGKEFSPVIVDQLSEELLQQNYPKKEVEEAIDFNEQLDILMNVLPDADPEYLSSKLADIPDNEELKIFISQALELQNYPKLTDVKRKQAMYAQVRRYITDFSPMEYLKIIPDPETYFTNNRDQFTRTKLVANDTYIYVYPFLRNLMNRISCRKIQSVMNEYEHLIDVVEALKECDRCSSGVITKPRKRFEVGNCYDIPLLQLFTYYQHRDIILKCKELLATEAKQRKSIAIANKEVKTCNCCYDEEVLPEDTFSCGNGCLVCKDCIARSTGILFAENNLSFPCLACCGEFYSLETLQSCVTPKIFNKIAKRKQLEEVKAAGLEDLEICPFCDFAAIPAATDKVFKCFNEMCMKETCRACKEPSHIPLRCDEVEKDEDVKQRVFVEDKMTEALMRKCWKCDLKYIKADGCNKITCQCGATMCYICKKSSVDYSHFNGLGGQEFEKCPLYSNTELLHEQNAINGGIEAKKELGLDEMKVDPLADAQNRIIKAKSQYVKRRGEQD